MKKLKHALLRTVDITALSFLEPVVRLAFGEAPRVQMAKIGRFIVVPVVAVAAFLAVWAVVAPMHKTKAGEVPTPAVVADAAEGILTFHNRESVKASDYTLTDDARERELAAAEARLEEIQGPLAEARAALEAAEARAAEAQAAVYDPLNAEFEALRDANREASTTRVDELNAAAEALPEDDPEAREAFLAMFRAHNEASREEAESLKQARSARDAALGDASPEVKLARKTLTALGEEAQFLTKRIDLLGDANRSVRLEDAEQRVAGLRETLADTSGPDAFKAARTIVLLEDRAGLTAESTYAKPATVPYQVIRSLACVFCGFVLGAIIAIPIGILCGLSKTFMAAMTPFIAVFKPVSPIVWLPIALIVVGGFISDPDSNPFIQALWDAPLIGFLKINPAFIASAITVALCSLWATLVNTALAVSSIDDDYVNVARVLRLNFFSRLFRIVLPSSLPLIFAGLRISLGVGWMVLIAAELLSSSEGIGKFVWDMFNNGSSESLAQLFVVVFIVGVIGLMLDRIMVVFQRLVSFDGSAVAV